MPWRLAFHTIKVLFSYWMPYKIQMFRDAIFNGDIQTIRTLAAERPRLLQQAIEADGNTALGLAIELSEIDVVKILLELGSDPNIANIYNGNHPLFLLAKLRSQENSKLSLLAKILLDSGSNPLYIIESQIDNDNNQLYTAETPLLSCIRYQNEDLLKIFIEYKVDINTCHADTFTSPLMLAATLGYNHICNILINADANVNASDYQGNTPLHLAIQNSNEQSINVIRTLLEHGADTHAVNNEDDTPIMLAQRMENGIYVNILNSQVTDNSSSHIYEELNEYFHG